MFREYGKIEEIRLQDDVAFVTFVKPESAAAALQHKCAEMDVVLSHLVPVKSVERDRRTVEEWEDMMHIAHKSNFAIHVHHDNLRGLLYYCSNHLEGAEVVGQLEAVSTQSTMLYMKVDDANKVLDTLHDARVLRYNRIYPSIDSTVRGSILDVARQLCNEIEKLPRHSRVRLQAFPSTLIDPLEAGLEEFRQSPDVQISESCYSHVYSVVGITAYGSDERGGVFLVGLSEPSSPLSKASRSFL